MKRINITNMGLVCITAVNFLAAVAEYLTPVRDVYLSNAFGWFCALCYIVSISIKEYNDNN